MPDPSTEMLHKSTVDVQESKLAHGSRDTTYSLHSNCSVREFHDVIGFFQIVAQLIVAGAGMNRSTGMNGRDSDLVTIDSIMPPDPSPLPVSSIAERYMRSMLECMAGYPLYEPHPFDQFSEEYSRNGINVGDVGFVREDGTFDVLFNICPPESGLSNPLDLSDGFSLETLEHSKTRRMRPLSRETCLYPRTVTITKSGEYMCEGSEGAILKLPDGAIQDEAMNVGHFEDLARRHGADWYKYTIARGRGISNGSLYLVTSSTKCTQWGIAVFDRHCDSGQGLTFVSSPLGWKGSRAFTTKVAYPNQEDTPNQCVFLRGYKIMIRQDIFDELRTRRWAQRIKGANFLSRILPARNSLTRSMMSTVKKSDGVVLLTSFNSSPVHPSDLFNAALLSQNPGAKVALTHDDVWCDLLRDNFPKLNYTALMNVAQSYKSIIDKYGCISLEKISDSNNILDESSRPMRGMETPAVQESIQHARDERNPDISMPAQASTVCQSPGTGEEGNLGSSVAPRPPFAISAPHSLRDKETRSRETRDSKAEDTVIVANTDPPIPSSSNPTSFHILEDDTLKAKPFASSLWSESPSSISHTEADKERFSSSSASSLGQLQQSVQSMTKRQHALQELLSSERAYASDLALICEVYIPLALGHEGVIPTPETSSQNSSASSPRTQSTASDVSHISCGPPMSMEDTKIIFNNVQELALFSDTLCDKLEKATGAGDDEDHVGSLFLSMIDEFKAPYTYYITRYSTALTHLQNFPQTPALTNYLSQTQSVASAVSHGWDLSLLLGKPVQQLLKYPLLLLSIYEVTPDGHSDKENLDLARKKMEEVARNVNEGRRRAEVVKEVLSSKKPLSTVNPSKMKNIRVGFNRVPADADNIEALKVERMHIELKRVDAFAQQFARNVLDWSRSMSNVVVALRVWAISFGKVIGLSIEQGSEAFDAFLSVVEEQLMPLCVSLEATVNEKLLKEIVHLLNSMTQPFKLLASMIEQEPLHLHLLTMNMNNRRPPPNLVEASNNYRALRDQLAAELPDYLLLLHKGLKIFTRRLVAIQTEFWGAVRNRWSALWNMLRVDGEMNAGYEETIKVWWARWTEVDDVVSSINIAPRRKLYTEIVVRSRNSTHSSGDSVTTDNVANVLSALEPTHASLNRTRARGASDASARAPRSTRTFGRKISNESLRSSLPKQTKPVRRKMEEFTDDIPHSHTGARHLAESFKTIASLFNSGSSAPPLSTAAASDESCLAMKDNDPRALSQLQPDSWIYKEAKYICRVIHSCVPPASTSYFSFPFFTLVEGDMYEVLQEAGHPSMHPKLPLYVDDGEDCLLLCRDIHQNVGWAFANFLVVCG